MAKASKNRKEKTQPKKEGKLNAKKVKSLNQKKSSFGTVEDGEMHEILAHDIHNELKEMIQTLSSKCEELESTSSEDEGSSHRLTELFELKWKVQEVLKPAVKAISELEIPKSGSEKTSEASSIDREFSFGAI